MSDKASASDVRKDAEQTTTAAARNDLLQAEFVAWYCDNYPPRTIISNPSWHAPKIYRAATRSLVKDNRELAEALQQFFTWLDEGLLVRDITKDASADWAPRMMEFVVQLNKAHAVLNAEVSTHAADREAQS